MSGVRAKIDRRRFLRRAGVLGLGLAVAGACGGGTGDVILTTLDGTIKLDGDGNLVAGPGEPYSVRAELAQAQARRELRRRPLAVFHHFSDFRIVDEESPVRSEWVESCDVSAATGAFRPQESLSLHAAAAMIARANRIDRSPVTQTPIEFAIHTGNAADNAQFNELRWFLDLMDGKTVAPQSGGPQYEGVQTESPSTAYGDLLNEAQLLLQPEGLRYPWYAVAGNRDVLVQGNFAPTAAGNLAAVGRQKITAIGPAARERVCAYPATFLEPDALQIVLTDPETVVQQVERDEGRRILSRKEWIEEHFATAEAPGPPGHGFSEDNRRDGTAFYVLDRGLVSFIVLDTTNPGGFSAGSIGMGQVDWLEQQLAARSRRYIDREERLATTAVPKDRLIVIVSHHGSADMNNPFADPQSQEERILGTRFEQILHRYPNVVLHIAGHSLKHRVTAKPDPTSRTTGYWEITTGSPLDYPMQSRLIEIVDNADGTLSIFTTVYDSAATINPGDAKDLTPQDGVNELLLAGVARQVGVRDPQFAADAAGLGSSDRNAELLLPMPFGAAPGGSPSPTAPSATLAPSETPSPGLRKLNRRVLLLRAPREKGT